MRYSTFFKISLFHQYYTGKCCNDFSIRPDEDSNRILKGHQMLMKRSGKDEISVLYPVNGENKPLIPPDKGLSFLFYMFLENHDFPEFTSLIPKQPDELYYFTNSDQDALPELAPSTIKTEKTKLQKRKPFGIIEITNNEYFSAPTAFTLTFKPSLAIWKYYLVTQIPGSNLAIEDKSAEIKFRKKATSQQLFQKDSIANGLRENFPDSALYLFESDSEVPCQEAGRKNIQLINNSTLLTGNLPNPSVKEQGIKIIKI